MRPDPLHNRPFFRPEAEAYRRFRHLGAIALFRPLPVRLLAVVPLIALAVAGMAAASLTLVPRAELRSAAWGGTAGVQLVIDSDKASYFHTGDEIELLRDNQIQGVARIEAIVPMVCPTGSSGTGRGHCLQIRARSHALIAAGTPLPTSVRGAPRRYLLPRV
ncbi:hypothetical protein [Stenotrophomonas sp.]|uniref:hypothetical protein n=1 Tax=Stenotrophomonas sp. TaxID=69392 RepID=UPI0031D25E80